MFKWLPLLPFAIWSASCSSECPDGQHAHRVTGSCVLDDEDRFAPSLGVNGADAGPTIIIGGHRADAGADADSGAAAPTSAPFAEVWAIERFSPAAGTHEIDVGAILVDDAVARVARTSSQIADLEGGHCALETRRVIGGQPRPYSVSAMHLQVGARRVDLSLLFDGTYAPTASPGAALLASSSVAELVIDDDGRAGGLDAVTIPLSVPPPISLLTPTPMPRIDLSTANSITWALLPLPTDRVVVELSTSLREVVLRCGTANDGFYALSPASLVAFRSEAGGMPFRLEVRSESQAVGLTSVDGQDPVPVIFRVGYGVQLDAR